MTIVTAPYQDATPTTRRSDSADNSLTLERFEANQPIVNAAGNLSPTYVD